MEISSINVTENDIIKSVTSPDYNYTFDKTSGLFKRWGSSEKDDPVLAPSPEIADIEVTTICQGLGGNVCKHCYKSNTPSGNNMNFDTFKIIFDKISKNRILTQIAFGADAHALSNPDLIDMMWYSRMNGVIPNITVANLPDSMAEQLAKVCGAVAVSRYENKDICYNTISKLHKFGLNQINIHLMVSEETFNMCLETLNDKLTDPRLRPVKAIILLSLKKKGRGINYTNLSQNKFNKLIKFAFRNKIEIGFDSCSALKFLKSIKNHHRFDDFVDCVEPCESTLFSVFINWRGEAFPCSFTDGCSGWEHGIDVLSVDDFVSDVWNSHRFLNFREKLIETQLCNEFSCRECPYFEV